MIYGLNLNFKKETVSFKEAIFRLDYSLALAESGQNWRVAGSVAGGVLGFWSRWMRNSIAIDDSSQSIITSLSKYLWVLIPHIHVPAVIFCRHIQTLACGVYLTTRMRSHYYQMPTQRFWILKCPKCL